MHGCFGLCVFIFGIFGFDDSHSVIILLLETGYFCHVGIIGGFVGCYAVSLGLVGRHSFRQKCVHGVTYGLGRSHDIVIIRSQGHAFVCCVYRFLQRVYLRIDVIGGKFVFHKGSLFGYVCHSLGQLGTQHRDFCTSFVESYFSTCHSDGFPCAFHSAVCFVAVHSLDACERYLRSAVVGFVGSNTECAEHSRVALDCLFCIIVEHHNPLIIAYGIAAYSRRRLAASGDF